MQARSRLYGRRIKGDLDLGLEPSRIDPGGDRRLAEIITPGGLLPGGTEQDILVQTAAQNYRIGTRRVIDDRVFRYCRAFEELTAQQGAFVDRNNYWQGDGAMPITVVQGGVGNLPVGATAILFDNAERIEAHELVDGWIVGVATDATDIFCMRIKDNELGVGSDATPGAYCAITLYRGMPHGFVGEGTHRCYVYPNLYRNLREVGGAPNLTLAGVMCVPLIKVAAATPYFWGLTWGIFYTLVGLANMVGTRVNEREFWFTHDGAIVHRAGNNPADPFFQRGGFILMDGNLAHDTVLNGDQLAMLQLSP